MNWPTPENIIKPSTDTEWPKWVVPHESHVVRKKIDGAPDHVSMTDFENVHVDRIDGSVTVLVKDEADEQRATSARPEEPVSEPVESVEEIADSTDGEY